MYVFSFSRRFSRSSLPSSPSSTDKYQLHTAYTQQDLQLWTHHIVTSTCVLCISYCQFWLLTGHQQPDDIGPDATFLFFFFFFFFSLSASLPISLLVASFFAPSKLSFFSCPPSTTSRQQRKWYSRNSNEPCPLVLFSVDSSAHHIVVSNLSITRLCLSLSLQTKRACTRQWKQTVSLCLSNKPNRRTTVRAYSSPFYN